MVGPLPNKGPEPLSYSDLMVPKALGVVPKGQDLARCPPDRRTLVTTKPDMSRRPTGVDRIQDAPPLGVGVAVRNGLDVHRSGAWVALHGFGGAHAHAGQKRVTLSIFFRRGPEEPV